MIHKSLNLALQLPGFSPSALASPVPGLKPDFTDLASLLSPLLNIAFYIATFLTFYFLVWGAFHYLMAQGKKEELQKATARITWALIGLAVILMAYLIAKFASEIFPPTAGGLPF